MRKWLPLTMLVVSSLLTLTGCSKGESEAAPTPTASIDNNSPAAKNAQAAPPATDTPFPGMGKKGK